MPDLHQTVSEAARTVLAENGAASPSVDSDTLAGLIATAAIEASRVYAAAQVDPAAELAAAEVPTPAEADQPA